MGCYDMAEMIEGLTATYNFRRKCETGKPPAAEKLDFASACYKIPMECHEQKAR